MKKITVKVEMIGYVYQEMEIDDDVEITDDNVDDVVLDRFDFGEASDICDSIDWKLRYASAIEITDEDDDTLWETSSQ